MMRSLVVLLVAACLLVVAAAPFVRGDANEGAAPGGGHTITFEEVLEDPEAEHVHDDEDDDADDDEEADDEHAVAVADSTDEAEEEESDEEKTRVLQLTAETFIDLLDTVNNLLVLFVDLSHGCYSCEIGIQLLEDLAIEDEWKGIEFGVFDCRDDPSVCQRYKVTDYPTVKLFNEGMGVYEYKRPSLARGEFENYLRVYTGPKFQVISKPEDAITWVESHYLTVLYFRKENDNKTVGSFDRTAAELFEDITFLKLEESAQNEQVLSHFSAQPGDFVLAKVAPREYAEPKLLRFEEPTVSRSKLRDWINGHFALPVVDLMQHSFASAMSLGLPLVVAHVPYSHNELLQQSLRVLWQLQDSYPRSFVFGHIDVEKEDTLSMQRIGIYDFTKVTFYLHAPGASHLYSGDTGSVASLQQWLQLYIKGRLSRHSIRQPAPATPEYINGVLTLVHDTFRRVVFDDEKDAIVFFYLPESSCDPCAKLLPLFEQVAQEFSKWSDSIVFGKINLYLNEASPGVQVSNFPTIKYFAADMKNKEFTFSGPRTLENLRRFVHDSSSFDLTAEEAKPLGDSAGDIE